MPEVLITYGVRIFNNNGKTGVLHWTPLFSYIRNYYFFEKIILLTAGPPRWKALLFSRRKRVKHVA
jgi:hypothetical protein